jgi:hypothetical protein
MAKKKITVSAGYGTQVVQLLASHINDSIVSVSSMYVMI